VIEAPNVELAERNANNEDQMKFEELIGLLNHKNKTSGTMRLKSCMKLAR
jgi:hypothetical protein